MNKKIFLSTCIVAIVVFIASLAMVTGTLTDYFDEQIEKELESEAEYIAHAMENEGLAYFSGLYSEKRVTLIDSEGKVLFDTDADAEEMDNHSDREEFKEAMEKGHGVSRRYSDTLMKKNIYYALKLDDGIIVRVSTTQYTAGTLLLGMSYQVCIIIFIVLVLCTVLSYTVTKRILAPINAINLDNPEEESCYEELAPLLSKITQYKKQIDRQIKEEKKKQEEFRLITENMNEGFLLIDKATNLLTFNNAALKMLDIQKVSEGSVLALNRTQNFRETVEKVLAGGHTEGSMEQGGRSYRLIANPVYEKNEVIGAVIVIIDVTETIQREQLRREFSSNVSHELKTPLTSISGFAELMKNGGVAEPLVRDFSKSIYDEASRMITLVNDIIKLGQLDEKTELYEREETDLYEIAKEVLERLTPEAEKRGIELSLDGESCKIYGVRQILSEMIYNLCDNAIKYNKQGGKVEVTVTSGKNENQGTVAVKDTGIGIPLSEQDRVFERFYRVDKSHSKEVGGTGLGLSIVKHAAIYHNAEIKLESEVSKGTKVTVKF